MAPITTLKVAMPRLPRAAAAIRRAHARRRERRTQMRPDRQEHISFRLSIDDINRGGGRGEGEPAWRGALPPERLTCVCCF